MPVSTTTLDDLKFLTVSEVAAILRVSKMTVYRLARTGELDGAVRVGRSFRIPEAAVTGYLEARPAGTPATA